MASLKVFVLLLSASCCLATTALEFGPAIPACHVKLMDVYDDFSRAIDRVSATQAAVDGLVQKLRVLLANYEAPSSTPSPTVKPTPPWYYPEASGSGDWGDWEYDEDYYDLGSGSGSDDIFLATFPPLPPLPPRILTTTSPPTTTTAARPVEVYVTEASGDGGSGSGEGVDQEGGEDDGGDLGSGSGGYIFTATFPPLPPLPPLPKTTTTTTTTEVPTLVEYSGFGEDGSGSGLGVDQEDGDDDEGSGFHPQLEGRTPKKEEETLMEVAGGKFVPLYIDEGGA